MKKRARISMQSSKDPFDTDLNRRYEGSVTAGPMPNLQRQNIAGAIQDVSGILDVSVRLTQSSGLNMEL
jgi:hypothetical protein